VRSLHAGECVDCRPKRSCRLACARSVGLDSVSAQSRLAALRGLPDLLERAPEDRCVAASTPCQPPAHMEHLPRRPVPSEPPLTFLTGSPCAVKERKRRGDVTQLAAGIAVGERHCLAQVPPLEQILRANSSQSASRIARVSTLPLRFARVALGPRLAPCVRTRRKRRSASAAFTCKSPVAKQASEDAKKP